MKLFVWANPYRINRGSSMVLAVAEDEESARAIASSEAAKCYAFVDCDNDDDIPDLTTIALGKPARVVDIPCAEWHAFYE